MSITAEIIIAKFAEWPAKLKDQKNLIEDERLRQKHVLEERKNNDAQEFRDKTMKF